MSWFTRKQEPLTARARELNAEIAALEFEIHQLDNAANCPDLRQIQTVLEETRSMPADPFLKAEEELAGSIPTEPERDCPGLFNDQGLRKFDLAGWCRRLKRSEQQPTTTKNEQLVTLIAAGRHHGHPFFQDRMVDLKDTCNRNLCPYPSGAGYFPHRP